MNKRAKRQSTLHHGPTDACLEFMALSDKFNPISTINLDPRLKNNLKTIRNSGRIKSAPILATGSEPSIVLELENYVLRELAQSHVPSGKVILEQNFSTKQFRVDAKLQVFREALLVLVQKLASYGSLLNNIKCAYEEALEIRNARIEEMETLKKSLLVIEAKAEEKIVLVRTQGRAEVAELLAEKIRLLQNIDRLKAESETQTKIIDKLSEELAFEHTLLMNEIDSRRLLSFDMKQLCLQMDIMRNKLSSNSAGSSKRESSEDPVVLRLALTKCQESLAEATWRLSEIEADYSEVVPKRDMNKLDEDHKELTKQIAKLNKELTVLQSQCKALEYKYETAKMECDHLANRNDTLAKNGTPRPDWNKCAEFVRGGIERWRKLIENKSSEDRLYILLVEMSTDQMDEKDAYFQGRGMDDSVPTYLRYEGKLKNRRLRRRDLSIFINDIWKERSEFPHLPMVDFVAKYFSDHFPIPLIQKEWAYSMAYSCEKLAHDDQIGMFWSILNGKTDESMYHSHMRDINACKEYAKKRLEFMNLKQGIVPALVFSEIVRTAFPFKADKQVAALVEAASKIPGTRPGEVNMLSILEETEEGIERTEFALELARQSRTEQEDFVHDILKKLGSVNNEPFKLITPEQLKKAFNDVDPKFDELQLQAHLKWVYGDENLKTCKPLMLSLVAIKLLTTSIHRVKTRRNY